MDFIQFIPQDMLVLVVALYALGMLLKKIEVVNDKYIIVFLLFFGIIMSIVMNGGISANSILLGVISVAVAVLGNQTYKQLVLK